MINRHLLILILTLLLFNIVPVDALQLNIDKVQDEKGKVSEISHDELIDRQAKGEKLKVLDWNVPEEDNPNNPFQIGWDKYKRGETEDFEVENATERDFLEFAKTYSGHEYLDKETENRVNFNLGLMLWAGGEALFGFLGKCALIFLRRGRKFCMS